MKSKKIMLLLIALVLLMFSFSFSSVEALNFDDNRLILTENDGLNVDVSGIKSSQLILDQEYIKANLNEAYVSKGDTLVPKDVILAKNLFANRNNLTSGATIDSLWFNTPEAFIVETDMVFPLYDIDESSNYYVAYVDTMHYDNNSNVEDVCFAYTNLNGEVITDAIYDNETGLVYLPKKYVEENKNGYGIENVQVELLQVVDTDTPKATFEAKVTSDVDEFKNLETEGLATVDLLNVKFGINLNIDEEAISNLSAGYLKVKINGFETDQWTYYTSSGILVLNVMPSTVRTLEIEISQENFDKNADRVTISGVSYTDTTVADMFGEWEVNQTPAVGSTFTIEGSSNIDVWYDAWNHNDPRGSYVPEMHVYGSGNTLDDTTLNTIFDEVLRGNGNLDLNNLTEDNTWLQYDVTMLQDTTVTASDGTQMVIPAGHWYLKCTHGARTFKTTHYIDPADPHRHDHTYELRGKVLQAADDYIIVGIVGSTSHTQSGAGIFKISVAGQTGGLEIKKTLGATEKDAKIDLSGAKFRLTSKTDSSLVYETNESGPDGKCRVEGVKFGDYVLSEIQTPKSAFKMADRDITIDASNRINPDGSVKTIEIENESKPMVIHIKKSTKLTEQEKTDATVAGAIFTVYTDAAATNPFVDKDGNVVTIGPTDANGEATSAQMRTGTYYLKETTFPTGIDKDKVIDEATGTTYATKIYVASGNPDGQTERPLKVDLNIDNEPKRNDIVIQKYIDKTSNTSKVPLGGCEFTATLKSSIGTDQVFSRKCTAETTNDTGYCIIEDLPYGEYVVEETKVNPYTLKADKFTVFVDKDRKEKTVPYTPKDGVFETIILDQNPQTEWLDVVGNFVDIPKVMIIKIHKVDADKTDSDSKTFMQGDANLKGAIYEIYKFNETTQDYTDYVYDITVDHLDDGYWTATSDELLVGKYMVKEKIKKSEVVDGVTYNYSFAPGYLVDPESHYFEQIPSEQTERVTVHDAISRELVQRGRVTITKYDDDRSTNPDLNDSDKVPSAGAILKLTLKSNPDIYYTVKLDDKGEGEFLETNDEGVHTSTAPHDGMKYYPNTIPYGQYEITEIQEGEDSQRESFFVQPENVDITNHLEHENRILADNPVPVWLKIVKKDRTDNETIKEAGATFSVWNVKEKRFEMQKVYPSAVENDKYETNEEGWLYLPQKLYPGDYVIYEEDPPEGYYADEEYRRPEDPAQYGTGGKKIHIDKVLAGLSEDAVNPGHVEVGEFEYEAVIKNKPLMVNIKVIKTSDRLTGASQDTISYPTTTDEEVEIEMTTPVYTDKIGLKDVEFQIYANEDIKTPDGKLRATKDQLMVSEDGRNKIVTNEDGIAQSWDLFPGQYRIVETKVPDGYLLDSTPKYVKAENKDKYVESATATLEVSDVRQHLGYKFKKIFEQYKYVTGGERKHAVFGIYTKDPIDNYLGDRVIGPDTLVDLLVVDGDNYVETTTDLPNGRYYVKELYVSYPYALSTDTVDFTLAYNGDEVTPKLVVEGPEIVNMPYPGYAKFIKLSKTVNDNVIMNGSQIDEEGLNEKSLKILSDIANMTNDQVALYMNNNGYQFVSGAEYEIWLDEEGTNKLQEVNLQTGDMKVATFTTDGSGILELFEIPKGAYYLKEVKAPEDYVIQEGVVPFTITSSNPETTLYQAIFDESVKTPFLHKTDIFTGENVPNCTFEITDESGKVILKATTDKDGLAWIPNDAFKPYKDVENPKFYYTELEAPDVYKEDGRLYKLNTESHEFTGTFDENTGVFTTDLHEVENYRPTTNVKFVKTDEESNLVPNCKFELKSEEENLYYKTGVTDENGIYVFEDVPQGWYTYTELEAPEKYDLDTTPHRVYVTGDEMVIDFVNTGDIPVVAIATLAIVCVAGIAFVTVRKFKLAKNN